MCDQTSVIKRSYGWVFCVPHSYLGCRKTGLSSITHYDLSNGFVETCPGSQVTSSISDSESQFV